MEKNIWEYVMNSKGEVIEIEPQIRSTGENPKKMTA